MTLIWWRPRVSRARIEGGEIVSGVFYACTFERCSLRGGDFRHCVVVDCDIADGVVLDASNIVIGPTMPAHHRMESSTPADFGGMTDRHRELLLELQTCNYRRAQEIEVEIEKELPQARHSDVAAARREQ